MLKTLLLFSAVFLLAVIAIPTSGRITQEAAPTPAPVFKNPVKPTAESQARAKKLYVQECAACHGDNGNGKTDLAKDMQVTLLDWTDSKSLAGKSDKELFDAIRKGKDKMPPEPEGRAKDDEVWNLIIYIHNMSKNSPAAAANPAN